MMAFSSIPPTEIWQLPPSGEVRRYDQWLSVPEQSELWRHLTGGQIEWSQPHLHVFGREVTPSRREALVAKSDIRYQYSGQRLKAQPWTAGLTQLGSRLFYMFGIPFNAVLLNHYAHGHEQMGWHSDNEPELGRNPVIASISLGAQRDFRFRPKNSVHGDPITMALPAGSLLLMAGDLQHHWEHCLPQRRRIALPRINLTFRRIMQHNNT